MQETLDRNGARGLAAVASTGGGARIPLITTTLSERFGVPVITTAHPELTAAIGGGINAARGTAEEGATAMAEAVSPPTAAAAAAMGATQMAPEVHPDDMGSGASSGLAWSEADEVPDVVAVTDPYDYAGAASTDAMGGPRPPMHFEPETESYEEAGKRSPFALLIAGLVIVLLAIALALWFVLRNDESTPSPSLDDRHHHHGTRTAACGRRDATTDQRGACAATAGDSDDHRGAPDRLAGTTATAADERGATATASDERGATPAAAVVGAIVAFDTPAAHSDAAVPDHPRSALCPGTGSARPLGSRP